jgi:hypothetical protein
VNCISVGFWFEAGRVLFGASVVGVIIMLVALYFGWLVWKAR